MTTTDLFRWYRTKRAGTMTVEVYRLSDDEFMGTVWRTRDGYSARGSDGRRVADDLPLSQRTVINLLRVYRQDPEEG